ncbi:hypothetical protein MPSEU_000046900 [Mayamaea pseudoterrestris]|nr:hypothetical protein MPSEU_000046900 [Mayamaea pseudoterrestris]
MGRSNQSNETAAAALDQSFTAQQQPRKKMMKSVECKLEHGNHVVVGSLDDEDDETELTWRLDANKSLSDWAVIVTTKETGAVQVYNVHKNYLAVGPRKSLYFAREFGAHAKRLQEQQELIRQQEQQKLQQQQKKLNGIANDKKGILPKQFAFHSGIEPCEMITRTLRNDRKVVDAVAPLSHQMVTKLELAQLAAEAFPQVLDYIYSGGTKLEVNTHNATALHYLADLFEIKPLRRFIRSFWQQDLCVENLCLYYKHASVIGDVPVLRQAQEFCARHIFEIPEDYVVQVLTAIDATFFFHVISHHAAIGGSDQKDDDEHDVAGEEKSSKALPQKDTRAISSKRLSLIVAVYCNIHRQDLNGASFLRLVGPDILPEIDLKAAKVLLELEYYICRDKDKLTSLKKRCIKVMSKKWDHVCVDTKDFDVVTLPRLGGEALERFVAMSFTNAKERLSTLDQIFLEWDKVQAELQRLRSEVRQLREEKKNFYGENIFETYGGALPKSTKLNETSSFMPTHLSMKGRAFTDVTGTSTASMQSKASAAKQGPGSMNGMTNGSSSGTIKQTPSFIHEKEAQHSEQARAAHSKLPLNEDEDTTSRFKGSSVFSGHPPSAASLSEYADFVLKSMPARVEAIEMARNRQKVALSAYEEAVAKLKQSSDARAAIEAHSSMAESYAQASVDSQAIPEWTASFSMADSGVHAPIASQASPERSTKVKMLASLNAARLATPERSTSRSMPSVSESHPHSDRAPKDPLLESPIASDFTSYNGSMPSNCSERRANNVDSFRFDKTNDELAPPIASLDAVSEQRMSSRQQSDSFERASSALHDYEANSFSHENKYDSGNKPNRNLVVPKAALDSPHSSRTTRVKNTQKTAERMTPPPQACLVTPPSRPVSTGRMPTESFSQDYTMAGAQNVVETPSRTATPSRPQEILKDAATTAKSLFSFTKNYIKTSASHFTNTPYDDDDHVETDQTTDSYLGGSNGPIHASQQRSTQGPHPATDTDTDDFSSSPVSVAVFDAAPSDEAMTFDVGSLVQAAYKSGPDRRKLPASKYQMSMVSATTASSVASTSSW